MARLNTRAALETLVAGLVGQQEGKNRRRREERQNLQNERIQQLIDAGKEPQRHLIRLPGGGFDILEIAPDGTQKVLPGRAGTGGGSPGAGVSLFTDENGVPFTINRATNIGRPVEFPGGVGPQRKPGQRLTDRNSGIVYNLITNPDGSITKGEPIGDVDTTVDTTTTSVGGEVTEEKTETKTGAGTTIDILKGAPTSIVEGFDAAGRPTRTTTKTTGVETEERTEFDVTRKEAPESRAQKAARLKAEAAARTDLGKEDTDDLQNRLNLLMQKIPTEADLEEHTDSSFFGPDVVDPVVLQQRNTQIRILIQIGTELNRRSQEANGTDVVDLEPWLKMLGEQQSIADLIKANSELED